MSKKLPRYPGAQPFETHQQSIFFGRDKDIEALCRKIRQEPLTVLYSKSGMGKSSLLNAGIIPQIEQEGEYRTLRIRFNAWDKDAPAELRPPMPDVRCRETIRGGKAAVPTFLDKLIENEATLWHDLKEQQILAHREIEKGGQAAPKMLLLFDQFEELFTYPAEAVLAFRKQLAEALYTPLPSRYWDMLELYGKDEHPLTEAEQTLLQKPMDLRVVMAIRQDRMHLLGQLSDYLPSVSKTWYELRPLTPAQARKAITAPAAEKGVFDSDPFRYEEQALDVMLNFLTKKGSEPIESTQLQIVCNSIEIKAAGQSLALIRPTDVGDLDAVIENYYLEKIASVGDGAQQLAARRLVEDGLIYEEEERRLSLYEGLILKVYAVSPETLRKLVDSHLLRAEPSLHGGYTYELSHDTLVAPVLKAKGKRKEEERVEVEREAQRRKELELEELRRRAEEERQKAEQEKLLREQAEQAKAEAEKQRALAQKNERWAKARTNLAAVIAVIAFGLAGFAFYSNYRAGLARSEADKSAEIARKELKARIDLEIKKYLFAAERMKKREDFDMAKKILEEARKLDSLNTDVKKLLEELQ
jgi:hypothetical protein